MSRLGIGKTVRTSAPIHMPSDSRDYLPEPWGSLSRTNENCALRTNENCTHLGGDPPRVWRTFPRGSDRAWGGRRRERSYRSPPACPSGRPKGFFSRELSGNWRKPASGCPWLPGVMRRPEYLALALAEAVRRLKKIARVELSASMPNGGITVAARASNSPLCGTGWTSFLSQCRRTVESIVWCGLICVSVGSSLLAIGTVRVPPQR